MYIKQVNTSQQTERDLKREKKKLGTIEYMCQVDLVSTIHIADKEYFRTLQKELEPYDSILYEMVASKETLENRRNLIAAKKLKSSRSRGFSILGFIQRQMARVLTLDFQLDCLDYDTKNWYHADLDFETFQLLQKVLSLDGSGTRDEVERFWFAFILYSVKRLSVRNEKDGQSASGANGFNLCQILRALKLKELPQFVVKAGSVLGELYGADWENRLQAKELQANFVHLSLLSKRRKEKASSHLLGT